MFDKKKWKFSRIKRQKNIHTFLWLCHNFNEQFYLTILRTVIISIPINSTAIFLWIFAFAWDWSKWGKKTVKHTNMHSCANCWTVSSLKKTLVCHLEWKEKFKWCFNKLHWRNRNNSNSNTNNNDTSHFRDWCVCIQFTENGLQSNDYDHSKMNEENREN